MSTRSAAPGPAEPADRLVLALQDLHRRAGKPSSRRIAAGIGTVSHTTVAEALSGRRIPTWPVVSSIVKQLGGSETEFRSLWAAATNESPTPTEHEREDSEFLSRYRELVADQYRTLYTPGHARRDRADIDDVYVLPAIVGLGDEPPAVASFGDTSAAAGARPTTISDFDERIGRTVLLGDPGSGKSTLCQVLVRHHALAPTGTTTPFLAPLNGFAAGFPQSRSLVGFIESSVEAVLQSRPPHGTVERQLANGGALVVLDGLDEIASAARRAEVVGIIEVFAAKYPESRVLVTSRITGYDEARLDPSSFSSYRILDFDRERTERYVRRSFARDGGTGAEDRAGAFLRDAASVADMCANPLLLAMLCTLYRETRSRPLNRPDTFDSVTALMLERWDASRGVEVPAHSRPLVAPVLQNVAFKMLDEDRREISGGELERVVKDFLTERYKSRDQAEQPARELLDFLRSRAWVFTGADDMYRFLYPSLGSYLAAQHLVRRHGRPGDVARKLLHRLAEPRWVEPGKLAVQLMDRTVELGAAQVFEKLIQESGYLSPHRRNGILTFLDECAELIDLPIRTERRLAAAWIDARVAASGSGPGGTALLDTVRSPQDLKALAPDEAVELAAEIRRFLVEKVARTGGHLGPNLGVVEVTLAVHRVFDSPRDPILFDTGYQAYVHKIVTGRRDGFDLLRQRGGMSGYPSRAESEHDVVENSHTSTALSYADGLARAYALRGEQRHVVAVVGNDALTGGTSWEALNNIARTRHPIVVVVNDNGGVYSPTLGGLSEHLTALRLNPDSDKWLNRVIGSLGRMPVVGAPAQETIHAVRKGIKDAVAPQAMFEDLGLKYVGPLDGHDLSAVESALRRAKGFGGPVIVHTITREGFGFQPADRDGEQGPPESDESRAPATRTWTSVFADELVTIAEERAEVVGITAGMPEATGMAKLSEKYPERAFDVGMAEAHAVTSAAGLALGGLHPVVAINSTLVNRAFDHVLLDVALHHLPVTFVVDRAGITGPDGPSDYGIWDMSIFGVVPGLRVAAPRDAATLRAELREAVATEDGPTVVRFPAGRVSADRPAISRVGGVDVLASSDRRDVLIVAVGAFCQLALDAAGRVAKRGYGVTVVDPRWIRPVPPELVGLAGRFRLVVTVEDGVRAGGFGDAFAQALRDARVPVPVRDLAVPVGFHPHGQRAEILADLGLTARDVARTITELLGDPAAITSVAEPTEEFLGQ
jgi:1-deoxy-D-xylulose-5-phosphate synthase